MKALLLLLLVTLLYSCRDEWHDKTMNSLNETSVKLDSLNIRATNQLRQVREMNHWLRMANAHSKKQTEYLDKYYATYNEKYFKLYKKYSDSTSYYLTKSINVK